MNDIHNNENISQEEEFVSPGQEKVNGKATPEQSGPSTGEPREQPGEPTEEAVEIEETEEIEIIEAGEFTVPKKEEEEEEEPFDFPVDYTLWAVIEADGATRTYDCAAAAFVD